MRARKPEFCTLLFSNVTAFAEISLATPPTEKTLPPLLSASTRVESLIVTVEISSFVVIPPRRSKSLAFPRVAEVN